MPLFNPGTSEGGTPGVYVADDGRLGVGTTELDADCQLTLGGEGDGNVALHAQQLRLVPATGDAPAILGGSALWLETSSGGGSVHLSETGPNEYVAASGTASNREGHCFLTGSSPQKRLSVADDAVILDVPLQFQYVSTGGLPSPAACAGALASIIGGGGSSIDLVYSNGSHWFQVSMGDIVA